MNAIARSTPSFSLPATQNTAPVYEFRCLYTHDVRKKAKKWHDGSAKFHTFNKRVMVYDDTKSYIGDLHYRADEEFGEGIELRLDRGVIVEVGERLGETQTDLTGVVNCRSSDGISPNARARAHAQPRTVQRASHINGQGRLKSLAEMFGTSQSRNGRVNLHMTSPFEQRQAFSAVQITEQPAKKRRTSFGKENLCPTHPSKDSLLAPSRFNRSPMATHSRNAVLAPAGHVPCERRIVDISSDEEPAPSGEILRSRDLRGTVTTTAFKPTLQPVTVGKAKPAKKANPAKRRDSIQPAHQTEASSAASASSHMGSDKTASFSLKPGMSSLKMRSQRPRRKLLYKALLPSRDALEAEIEVEVEAGTGGQIGGQSTVGNSGSTPPQESNPVLCSSGNEQDRTFEPNVEMCDEVDPPITMLNPPDNTPKAPAKSSSQHTALQCSPLFVSQTASQRSPTPLRTFVEDDFTVPATQEPRLQAMAIFDDTELSSAPSTVRHQAVSEPESPCFPLPPHQSSFAASASPFLMPLEQQPKCLPDVVASVSIHHTPSPNKSRAFTRSLSANDSPLLHDPRATPTSKDRCLAHIENPPLDISNHVRPFCAPPLPLPTSHHHQASPSKSPLQRSRSDTAAIVPNTVTAPLPIPASTSEEQGPWTSLEAFLLFDKWPACKQRFRPEFEPLPDQELDEEDEIDRNDSNGFQVGFVPAGRIGRGNAPPVLIRSARSFLRDG